MTYTWHYFGLFFIPGKDQTSVGVEHVDGYVHQCLEYLIETYIPQNALVGFVERLDFLVARLERAGPLTDESFQIAVAILYRSGTQPHADEHHRDNSYAE